MDKILKGVLLSNEDRSIKDQLVWKVAKAGSTQPQTQLTLSAMIRTTMHLLLHERDEYILKSAKEVFKSWTYSNSEYLAECFTPTTVLSLMQESFDSQENVPWLLHEIFNVFHQNDPTRLPEYFKVVEYWTSDFISKHVSYRVLNPFCCLLRDFPHCIPKGQLTRNFCFTLLSSISCLNPCGDSSLNPVEVIHEVNRNICGLLGHVWQYSTEDIINASLQHIFTLLSNGRAGASKDPDICLGGIVSFIPLKYVEPSINHLLNDTTVNDEILTVALKRMISWLSWPGTDNAYSWIRAFIVGLRLIEKDSIARHCIETQIDKIADMVQFPVVREANLNILYFMLLTSQDSPDPWLKVASNLAKHLQVMRDEFNLGEVWKWSGNKLFLHFRVH